MQTVTIDSRKSSDMTLIENELAKSVYQNILLILATRQGTVPMYREFGLPMEFIDKPIEVAKAILTREIYEAVERFEPRAVIKDISFVQDTTKPGKIAAILEVQITE